MVDIFVVLANLAFGGTAASEAYITCSSLEHAKLILMETRAKGWHEGGKVSYWQFISQTDEDGFPACEQLHITQARVETIGVKVYEELALEPVPGFFQHGYIYQVQHLSRSRDLYIIVPVRIDPPGT